MITFDIILLVVCIYNSTQEWKFKFESAALLLCYAWASAIQVL